MMGILHHSVFVKCWLFAIILSGVQSYDFTIVHINDLHSRYEETTIGTKECTAELANRSECIAGEARRASVVKDMRSKYPNTLLLDAGDRFVGKAILSDL